MRGFVSVLAVLLAASAAGAQLRPIAEPLVLPKRSLLPVDRPLFERLFVRRVFDSTPGSPAANQNLPGEIEIAVDDLGERIVIGVNNVPSGIAGFPEMQTFSNQTLFFSSDGGRSFRASRQIDHPRSRDPSVAWGGSGNFYFSTMGSATDVQFSRSTDGGATFRRIARIGQCVIDDGDTSCTSDQPHLAATRRTPAGGDDTLYLAWRSRSNPSGVETELVQCSVDGGDTWSSPTAAGRGEYVRIGTDSLGRAFAIWVDRRNGGNVLLRRFRCSASEGAVAEQPAPVVAATFDGVPCASVPGLDRCNSGNVLSSPFVAPDPVSPNQVAVVFATTTEDGKQEVRFARSRDGGDSFAAPERFAPALELAPRFLPWACPAPGGLFATWYDRGRSRPERPDLTDYLVHHVRFDDPRPPTRLGLRLNDDPDPQCSIWPVPPRSATNGSSCNPVATTDGVFRSATACPPACPAGQLCVAGRCSTGRRCSLGNAAGTASCPAAEPECSTGSGLPKYGDYNGVACLGNRVFAAWASTVPPDGVAAPDGLNVYFAVAVRRDPVKLPPKCIGDRGLCPGQPPRNDDKVELLCKKIGCLFLDPIENFCPGGGPCPKAGVLELSGVPEGWTVRLVDRSGDKVASAKKGADGRTVLPLGAYDPASGRDLYVAFELHGRDAVGKAALVGGAVAEDAKGSMRRPPRKLHAPGGPSSSPFERIR